MRYILNTKSKVQVNVYNTTGQVMLQQQLLPAFEKPDTQQQQLHLPDLKPGMYLLRLTSGKQNLQSKLIISH